MPSRLKITPENPASTCDGRVHASRYKMRLTLQSKATSTKVPPTHATAIASAVLPRSEISIHSDPALPGSSAHLHKKISRRPAENRSNQPPPSISATGRGTLSPQASAYPSFERTPSDSLCFGRKSEPPPRPHCPTAKLSKAFGICYRQMPPCHSPEAPCDSRLPHKASARRPAAY